MSQTIELRLIVDGREATVVIDNVKSNIESLHKAARSVPSPVPGGTVATVNDAAKAVNRMQLATGGLGYALGDASMFMVDFRMGMMSIGNNIPVIVDHFAAASREAKGMGVSVKDVLVQSLKGPGGLMLAINGVVLLMQVLPYLFSKQTDAIKDQAKEVENLKNEYQKLTREQLQGKIAQAKVELAEKEAQRKLADQSSSEYKTFGTAPGSYSESNNQAAATKAKLDPEIAVAKEKLKVMEDELHMLGDKESTQNRITQLQQKEKDLNDQNWKSLVPQAKDRADAAKVLGDAITREEKLLKDGKSGTGSGSGTGTDDRVKKLLAEFEAEQDHLERLAQLNGASELQRLELHRSNLEKRRDMYLKFGMDAKGIEYSITEFTIQIESKKKDAKTTNRLDDLKDEELRQKTLLEIVNAGEIAILNLQLSFMQEELAVRKEHGENVVALETKIQETIARIRVGEAKQTQQAEAQKEKGKEEAAKKSAEDEIRLSQDKVNVVRDFVGDAGSLFGQHTAAYKSLMIARAMIDAYGAGVSALKDYPFPFNLIAMGSVIAQGVAVVQQMQDVKVPGYAKGGVVVGENGPEVIQPMQDYASGWAQVINATVRATERALQYGGGGGTTAPREVVVKQRGKDLEGTYRIAKSTRERLAW